jgi:peroxiredoxin
MRVKLLILFSLILAASTMSFGCSPVEQPPAIADKTPVPTVDKPSITTPITSLPIFVDNTTMLKVGSTAPNFALRDLNGEVTTLSNLRGKKVIVNMWWLLCHGCTDEMPFMQEYFQKWPDPNVVLLAVNVYDPRENIQAFANVKNLTFTILIDPDKIMSKAYVNTGVPTTFFIDKDGVVRKIKDGMFDDAREILDMVNSY